MPIFEYECSDCKKKFEELVNASDAKPECPACKSANTRKLLSVFAASVSSGQSSTPSCSRPGCGSGFG